MGLRWQIELVRALGIGGTCVYHLSKRFGTEIRLRPLGLAHSLAARPGTSDIDVFADVYAKKAYAKLRGLVRPGLILDCGANVGYSTAYLLSECPGCHAIAVEPDPDNFKLLLRNVAPYEGRVRPVHAGVWSSVTRLAVEAASYRDNREWTRQVRSARPDEVSTIQGMDIPALMAITGDDEISLMKVDVEGAEAVIFGDTSDAWLHKVRVIAIELHDDSSFGRGSEVFHHAIRNRDFVVFQSGELTICHRASPG
jgi:FkbM family methyltransferase